MAASTFIPRSTFPTLTLPRSYYLGHHAAGLSKMKTLLSSIDLVIECRDFRIPLTSRNPLLEDALAGRDRIIVYTHRDLCPATPKAALAQSPESIITSWHAPPTRVHFFSAPQQQSARPILRSIKALAHQRFSITGHRVLVAGLPNVGKSTLLNALRHIGVNKGKAARTGAQPGVTRKVSQGVKIVERRDGIAVPGTSRHERPKSTGRSLGRDSLNLNQSEPATQLTASADGAERSGDMDITMPGTGPIYLLDTPGVFMPYVPSPSSMLKLALCGSVKDALIAPVSLADYLLFHMNLSAAGPGAYAAYAGPTNSVLELLDGIARRTGRLKSGGVPDVEGAAVWMVQRWRAGDMGRFALDEVVEGGLEQRIEEEAAAGGSISAARRGDKEARRERLRERRVARATD